MAYLLHSLGKHCNLRDTMNPAQSPCALDENENEDILPLVPTDLL